MSIALVRSVFPRVGVLTAGHWAKVGVIRVAAVTDQTKRPQSSLVCLVCTVQCVTDITDVTNVANGGGVLTAGQLAKGLQQLRTGPD